MLNRMNIRIGSSLEVRIVYRRGVDVRSRIMRKL